MARDRGPAMAVKRNSAKGLQHHYGSFTGGVALSRARARKLTGELPNLALARCNWSGCGIGGGVGGFGIRTKGTF